MAQQQKQKKSRRARKTFTAMEKCEAVLAVWTERRTITEISKEMEVNPVMIGKWQETAMEAMLNSLESKRNQKRLPALNAKLEKLLEKKCAQKTSVMNRLEQRLENIQQKSSQKKTQT